MTPTITTPTLPEPAKQAAIAFARVALLGCNDTMPRMCADGKPTMSDETRQKVLDERIQRIIRANEAAGIERAYQRDIERIGQAQKEMVTV